MYTFWEMYWFAYTTHAVNFDVVSSRIYPMVSIHRCYAFGTLDAQYGRSLSDADTFHSIYCLPSHCRPGCFESKTNGEKKIEKFTWGWKRKMREIFAIVNWMEISMLVLLLLLKNQIEQMPHIQKEKHSHVGKFLKILCAQWSILWNFFGDPFELLHQTVRIRNIVLKFIWRWWM